MEAKPFFNGPPLDLSVRLLEEAIGQPERGQVVSYVEIERITNEKYRTNRFEGVVDLWRQRILDKFNIASRRIPGESVRFLLEAERSGEDIKDLRGHTRRQMATVSDLKKVDRAQLPATVQARHDHALQVAAKLEAVAYPIYKALEPPPSQRRLQPPPLE